MKTFTFFILTILFLTSCKSSRKEVVINNQKLLYDSTKTKDKLFEVTLITTLELESNIEYKYLNKFYIIANTDTILLKNEKSSISPATHKQIIEYSTVLKQKVEKFEDYIFVDSVKNYEIINKNLDISVIKSPEYSMSSLIKLWINNDKSKIQ